MSWESSSRRRSAQRSSSSRLRMDSYSSSTRSNRNRASPPKRRELDKVMKKARRDGPTQSSYWNKKLLEAEEKDPNRWRHSGYKELYGGGTSSPHGSRSSYKRSQSRSRSHSRSRSRSRTPRGSRRGGRNSRVRSPLPVTRARSRDRERRPHTPQPVSQKVTASSSSSVQRRSSVKRSPNTAVSVSASSRSLSSCSDESCSVCSPKGRRKAPVPRVLSPRSRSRSFSVPRSRPTNRSPVPKRLGRERSGPPIDPRGPPPSPPPIVRKTLKKRKEERAKANNAKKRKSGTKDRVKRRRSSVVPAPGTMNARGNSSSPLTSTKQISRTRRGVSPAASGCSDDSSVATSGSSTAAEPPRLTLSERFGKMAQWSVDRRDLDGVRNMRITKDAAGDDLKVVIEGERYRSSNAPLSPGEQFFMPSDAAPSSLADLAWDDVRVRYKYYKERGYLRDLTLDDYIKWEEWWYKYQEWLEAERYYEHWAAIRAEQSSRSSKWGGGSSGSSVRKRRRV